MSNIDRLRVGGTDYDIQSVVKVYNTIADMNADIANIPNGATVFVKENSPSGLEGDDELDPTSSNWVKNSALAEVVVTVEDGSSTPSIPDSELRHSDMSNTQVNDVNKVPTSALLYQMNSDLSNINRVVLTSSGSDYTIYSNQNYPEPYYLKRAGFCFVSLCFTCVTPKSNWTQICTLPTAAAYNMIMIPSAVSIDDGTSIPLLFIGDKLYVKSGTASKVYAVSFVYPSD